MLPRTKRFRLMMRRKERRCEGECSLGVQQTPRSVGLHFVFCYCYCQWPDYYLFITVIFEAHFFTINNEAPQTSKIIQHIKPSDYVLLHVRGIASQSKRAHSSTSKIEITQTHFPAHFPSVYKSKDAISRKRPFPKGKRLSVKTAIAMFKESIVCNLTSTQFSVHSVGHGLKLCHTP